MTFDTDETIMDDFSIQRVTPPLVDPLTEAANAHLAALAEAEAAEMIIPIKTEEVGEFLLMCPNSVKFYFKS